MSKRLLIIIIGVVILAGGIAWYVQQGKNTGAQNTNHTYEATLTLSNRKLSESTLSVHQNDTVTLHIQTDEAGEVHIHGYEIPVRVNPAQTSDVQFTANMVGSFPIEFHPGAEDHDDTEDHEEADGIPLGRLTVNP